MRIELEKNTMFFILFAIVITTALVWITTGLWAQSAAYGKSENMIKLVENGSAEVIMLPKGCKTPIVNAYCPIVPGLASP